MSTLRIGSRGSQLALVQAHHIKSLLETRGHTVTIEIMKTTGDKITDVALAKVGTKGMFTKEIEEALVERRIDLAVHSLKDLPTEISAEFELAAISEREDPHDVLCSTHASLGDLPSGARVGTSSLRRQAQLRAVRPDLQIDSLRGNVDTRLRKLAAGDYDAIILAAAGLRRLGKFEAARQVLPADVMCPAAGQGALAIEIRAGDTATREAVAFLDNTDTRRAVTCERALLNKMGGGCQVPIGAYAEYRGRELHLQAVVAHTSGESVLRESGSGEDAIELGERIAVSLLGRGGRQILQEVYGESFAVPEQP